MRARGRPGQPMPAPDLQTYRAQQNLPWLSTCTGFAMQNSERALNSCTSEDPDEAVGSRMEAWPIKSKTSDEEVLTGSKGVPSLLEAWPMLTQEINSSSCARH